MALLLLGLLAGCAEPTLYAPATDGDGYSEKQLETNRYRVAFAGNTVTPRDRVETYLLYRAAEITLATGNDYFRIVEQDTEPSTRYQSTFNGFDTFGGFHRSPFFGLSTGSSRPITSYEAVANIVVLQGEKPESDAQAYDARDVIARLGPEVQRPEEAEQPTSAGSGF